MPKPRLPDPNPAMQLEPMQPPQLPVVFINETTYRVVYISYEVIGVRWNKRYKGDCVEVISTHREVILMKNNANMKMLSAEMKRFDEWYGMELRKKVIKHTRKTM